MDTWGYNSFENDNALEWLTELETNLDDAAIVSALNEVIEEAEDYIAAPTCAKAIAAAEVVAALNGEPVEDLPEEVAEWVEERPTPNASLLARARQTLEVIQSDSELKEIWLNSDDFDEWNASVEDLLDRLS